MKKFDYNTYPGNYQYNAMHKGIFVQRFLHSGKLQLIDAISDLKKDERVLDFGCGAGNLCFHVSNKCKQVFGVDIKGDAIDFANQLKKQKEITNCTFTKIGEDNLPFRDNSFDKVFLLDVIEHISVPVPTLKEIKRVLRINGQLIVTTPNYNSLWPALELITDLLKITPENSKQHVTRLTEKKGDALLTQAGFLTIKKGSVFLSSPFIPISKIANKLLDKEIKNKPCHGMLLYFIAQKIS